MDEVNYIPGDEVIFSFTVKNMRGDLYKIINFSSLNTVYMLKTVLAEMTIYSPGQMNLYCSGIMRDNFAIEYYGIGDGRNFLLCLRLRANPRIKRRFRQIQVIICDVSESKTE